MSGNKTGSGDQARSSEGTEADDATPKGTPNADRHDMETQAGRQEGRETPQHK